MADKVLVVDDDKTILTMLHKALKSSGITADLAISGEAAITLLAENEYDLILLDINMRGMDGFEVIQKIRGDGLSTPVMVVSGRKEDKDALYGLEIGADDYITKPFNPVTLVAKAKALIRRSRSTSPQNSNIITAGPFTYNTSTLRFYKNDVEIPLSSKENSMMKLFIDNVDHIFSKDMIYSVIWGETIIDENAIMVYVNRLRQKIEDDPSSPKYLITVRGLGYRFTV
ncbi:MAG: response regulator transcription factor [Mogibacterium sp.]|nr:response regulator transcription factor [Mogibacterium sp.]MBR2539757.1 response regulator transcription factor [Mogibacterium sp.]